MKGKTYLRYSESFKQEVVRHIEQSGEGLDKVCLRLGIGSRNTLVRWLKRYGNPKLRSTKIIVMKADEQNQLKQQEQLRRRYSSTPYLFWAQF